MAEGMILALAVTVIQLDGIWPSIRDFSKNWRDEDKTTAE